MALAGIDRRRDVPVSKWRGMELRQREDRTKFSRIECTTCDDVSSRLFGGRGRGSLARDTKSTERVGGRIDNRSGIRWGEQSYGHGNNWIMSSRSRPESRWIEAIGSRKIPWRRSPGSISSRRASTAAWSIWRRRGWCCARPRSWDSRLRKQRQGWDDRSKQRERKRFLFRRIVGNNYVFTGIRFSRVPSRLT